MDRLSLRARLLIVGLSLQAGALLLMALASLVLVDAHLRRETQQRIAQFGPFMNAALATPMAQRDYASVAAILQESREARGFDYLIVTDAAGRLIAQDGDVTLATPSSSQIIDTEVRLTLSGQLLGGLRFGLSSAPIAETRAEAARIIALVAVLVLVLCSAVLYWLESTLTQPLRQLELAARDIHAGNYEVSLPTQRQDDLGMLMRAFERMRHEIERKVTELTQSEALQRRYLAQSIEQQGRTEEALRAAEQANRARAEFIANMSHEIRTPMNAIIGLTDLALETALSSQQRDYLNLVRSSADHLLIMVNDILDFSKIDAGRLQLEQRDFSLHELAHGMVALHASSAKVKGVALTVALSPELPVRLKGDVLRIGQVLNNLLANAVKFTEQGQIALEVHAEGPASAPCVHFSVRDSGIGISADKLRDIFEPFVQADTSITRRFGGTGLGLSIARKLALALGGELLVSSVEGVGSVFTLVLPLLPAASPMAPAAEPGSDPDRGPGPDSDRSHLPPRRVLLVEDNPVNQMVARTLLEQQGHAVVCAADGREGLERWAEGEIDLILMDVQMPVLDGLSATRELRERERESGRPRTPVIAMTANAMSGDREACMAAGMDDYIAKPFRRDQLSSALARTAGGPGQRGSAPGSAPGAALAGPETGLNLPAQADGASPIA